MSDKKNITDAANLASQALERLSTWFEADNLKQMNEAQSTLMVFAPAIHHIISIPDTISSDSLTLSRDSKFEQLGVIMDEKPNIKCHISYMNSETACATGILYKLRYYDSNPWLIRLYNTYALCHINYGCSMWSMASNININLILAGQHKALKTIFNFPVCTPSIKTYANFKILDPVAIREMQDAIFMFRSINEVTLHRRQHVSSDLLITLQITT